MPIELSRDEVRTILYVFAMKKNTAYLDQLEQEIVIKFLELYRDLYDEYGFLLEP